MIQKNQTYRTDDSYIGIREMQWETTSGKRASFVYAEEFYPVNDWWRKRKVKFEVVDLEAGLLRDTESGHEIRLTGMGEGDFQKLKEIQFAIDSAAEAKRIKEAAAKLHLKAKQP